MVLEGRPMTFDHQAKADEAVAAYEAAAAAARDDAEMDREIASDELQRLKAADQSGHGLLEVLPPTLAVLFRKRAEAFPVPPEMLVVVFLAITCSIWGKRGKVVVKKGHSEPLIIWVGLVALPSAMKSPVAAEMMAPLITIYSEKRAAFEKELGRIKAEQEPIKEDMKRLRNEIRNMKGAGRDATAHEEELAKLQETIPETPTLREYFIAEVSWEQLGQFCSRPNVKGLVLRLDELEAWLRLLDQQPAQRSKWLELWGGGGIKQDYKTAQSAYAEATAVSIFGNTTPDNIRDRVAAEAAKADAEHREGRTGDGMWPRMLWCQPPHVPPYSTDAECTICMELLSIYRAIDDLADQDITLQPEARAYLREAHDALVSEAEGNIHPLRMVYIGKLRGYLYRFAGWVAIVDRAWLHTPFSGVTLEQAKRGHRLALYFLGQFDRMAPLMGASGLPEWVPRLIALAEKLGGAVTARQYRRSCHRLKAAEARERLQAMADVYGQGRVERDLQGGQVTWHV